MCLVALYGFLSLFRSKPCWMLGSAWLGCPRNLSGSSWPWICAEQCMRFGTASSKEGLSRDTLMEHLWEEQEQGLNDPIGWTQCKAEALRGGAWHRCDTDVGLPSFLEIRPFLWVEVRWWWWGADVTGNKTRWVSWGQVVKRCQG